uniref:N-acetyltransferase domain-containing protein n=1 Tax=Panagrolaimus superbus TaxID=310955 RepID=A0A914ZAC6_9BILA
MYSCKKLLSLNFGRFGKLTREYLPELIPWTSEGRYLIDKRQKGDRKELDFKWTLKDGRNIRFEIADEYDLVLVAQQMNDGFVREVNLCKALDSKFNDFAAIHFEMIKRCLPFRGSLLGFHENKLVCFRIIRYIESCDFEAAFGPPLKPGTEPKVVFKSDYANDITKLPSKNEKCKIIWNFLFTCEHQINQFIPVGTKKIAFGEAVFVHSDFQSRSIGKAICHASEELAHLNGCEYIANITVAKNSSNIAFRKNFQRLFAFPYDKYIVDGKIVFKNLEDDATEANVFLGKL